MPEPADSAAVTAAVLLNDNRTAVGGKTATGFRVAVLPTLPNGLTFGAKTANGTTDAAGTKVVADATKAAHIGSADVDRLIVPIDFATTSGAGTGSRYVRKQWFKITTQPVGAVVDKLCYTNLKGQPLAANGTPTTPTLAANAATTPLTAVGEAVTSYSQPGPVPGTYQVTERQMGYAPSIGWVVKQVAQNGV